MTSDPQSFRARLFDAVLPVLEAEPAVRGVWEGGSVATGRADAFSDIDLCVVAEMARHADVLEADPAVRGVWEGGSVATGRADAFSDIDLCVVAETGRHADVLDAIEDALGRAASIGHTWHVDPQSYTGVTQRIYLLHDAPPFFAFDCALIAPDASVSFLERERHGAPRVLLDRDNALVALPLDRTAHAARMQARFAQIRAAWPVYRTIVEKELTRGRALDAIGFYLNGLVRPLLELVGMRHRPERYDFGWRYLHGDLPPAMQRELERLAYVADIDTLRANLDALDRLSADLFAELPATPFAVRLAERAAQ